MKLLALIAKKLLQLGCLSLLVTLATFLLSSLIPGDFFTAHLLDPTVRPETVQHLRHQYRLDEPFYLQYLHWLRDLTRLDFGYSLFYQRPVAPVVVSSACNTLWIGLPALLLGFSGGITLGSVHALLRRQWAARVWDTLSMMFLSLPTLVLGLAALLFAAQSHWFPLGGMGSPDAPSSLGGWFADRVRHLVLPVFCLTLPLVTAVERLQFSAVQRSLNHAYLRAAQCRGLGRARIFFQYVLRPALNPILSVSGPMFAAVLSGSLVLEVIFAWPGLGQITYDALFNNDLYLLVGCVLASCVLLIVGNLIADLLLSSLDPRVRAGGGALS